jgi:hypothetical protein
VEILSPCHPLGLSQESGSPRSESACLPGDSEPADFLQKHDPEPRSRCGNSQGQTTYLHMPFRAKNLGGVCNRLCRHDWVPSPPHSAPSASTHLTIADSPALPTRQGLASCAADVGRA